MPQTYVLSACLEVCFQGYAFYDHLNIMLGVARCYIALTIPTRPLAILALQAPNQILRQHEQPTLVRADSSTH